MGETRRRRCRPLAPARRHSLLVPLPPAHTMARLAPASRLGSWRGQDQMMMQGAVCTAQALWQPPAHLRSQGSQVALPLPLPTVSAVPTRTASLVCTGGPRTARVPAWTLTTLATPRNSEGHCSAPPRAVPGRYPAEFSPPRHPASRGPAQLAGVDHSERFDRLDRKENRGDHHGFRVDPALSGEERDSGPGSHFASGPSQNCLPPRVHTSSSSRGPVEIRGAAALHMAPEMPSYPSWECWSRSPVVSLRWTGGCSALGAWTASPVARQVKKILGHTSWNMPVAPHSVCPSETDSAALSQRPQSSAYDTSLSAILRWDVDRWSGSGRCVCSINLWAAWRTCSGGAVRATIASSAAELCPLQEGGLRAPAYCSSAHHTRWRAQWRRPAFGRASALHRCAIPRWRATSAPPAARSIRRSTWTTSASGRPCATARRSSTSSSSTKDGIKFFEWENSKDLSKYTGMTPAQVTAELGGSNYLTKWVD